jgi:hypothetical protein
VDIPESEDFPHLIAGKLRQRIAGEKFTHLLLALVDFALNGRREGSEPSHVALRTFEQGNPILILFFSYPRRDKAGYRAYVN